MKLKIKNGIFETIKRLFSEGGLYYINGPQTLPPPLSKEEEDELTARLPYDAEAKNILIERNLRLVVYIARKFESSTLGIEDLISIGTIGLIKAISTFKNDRQIKLATYASRCIENEILMFIRKNAGLKSELSLDEPLNTDYDGNELLLCDVLGTDGDHVYKSLEESEDRRMIAKAIESLSPREKRIIELRYGMTKSGKELTQKEAADALGISQSYISRLEKKIIAKLKDYLIRQNY